MQSIVKVLEKAFQKRNMAHLELFCGNGTSLTYNFTPLCSFVVGVDTDDRNFIGFNYTTMRAGLVENSFCGARGSVFITADSIQMLNSLQSQENLLFGKTFDLVSADAPQGLYGNGYCEHFDIIGKLPRLVREPGFLLFNVNLRPFIPTREASTRVSVGMRQEDFPVWMDRRKEFYGRPGEKLGLNWIIGFYENLFKDVGYPLSFSSHYMRPSALPGHPDHVAYLLFEKG